MILLIIIAFFLGLIFQDFFSYFSYLSVDLHSHCLRASPSSPFLPYYQSLVCGQKLYNSQEGLSLRQMGLIHLFVVSGAHLQFLDRIFSPLKSFQVWHWLRLPFLLIFVLTAAFPITALRAWFFLLIQKLNKACSLHYSNTDQLLLSILLCLFIFPNQYQSAALPLSWMASLGLQLGKNSMSQSTWIYFLTLPILCSFQWLSPWTILVNAFLAPAVGSVLFPASFFTFVFPLITSITDSLWGLFHWLTSVLTPKLQSQQTPLPALPHFQYWIYCLLLHFGMSKKINKRSR